MSEQGLFNELAVFFDGMADEVRTEISVLLMALADAPAIDTQGWGDCERDARALFQAEGYFGRLGDLIKTVGVLDAYFAADPRARLVPVIEAQVTGDARATAWQNVYAARLVAIECAQRDWEHLRQTRLTTAAISQARIPPAAARSKSKHRSSNAGRSGRIQQASG